MNSAVSDWLAVRREADAREQYATQLDHISSLLIGAHEALMGEFNQIDRETPIAEFYEACHQFDRRIIWLGCYRPLLPQGRADQRTVAVH